GLYDSDPDARVAAAEAYWSVSGKADAPVRILRAAIQPSSTWFTRMGAANALAEIGPAAKAAIPELIACLKSNTQYVVTSSVAALGKMGPDAASTLPDLNTLLNDSDDHYTRVYI